MVAENIPYPAVLESVVHVLLFIKDLDEGTAISTLEKLLTIEESEAAADISSMMIYFAFYRQNHFERLGPFGSDEIRTLLRYKLVNGDGQFRATAANHFKTLLDHNEIEFATLIPFLEQMVAGASGHVVNHHLYGIMAKYANPNPEIVSRLMEELVFHELKSLDSGGREIWHPKEFSDALLVLEQTGDEYKRRVEKIRVSIEPYWKQQRIFEVGS